MEDEHMREPVRIRNENSSDEEESDSSFSSLDLIIDNGFEALISGDQHHPGRDSTQDMDMRDSDFTFDSSDAYLK